MIDIEIDSFSENMCLMKNGKMVMKNSQTKNEIDFIRRKDTSKKVKNIKIKKKSCEINLGIVLHCFQK